jgi:hypothetical protein
MTISTKPHKTTSLSRALIWLARLSSIAAIIPLMLIVFGERGTGPEGIREWLYLALFPFTFSAGYLLAWRWPMLGGSLSLASLAASLLVIGRTFNASAYLIWAVLSIPGVLFVVGGYYARNARQDGGL